MQQDLQQVESGANTSSWPPAPPHEFVTTPPPEWASRPTLIRDKNGNEVGYASGNGYWWECFYDQDAKLLVFRNSSGYWKEMRVNINGRFVSKRDSHGSWKAEIKQENPVIAWREEQKAKKMAKKKARKDRAKVKREKPIGQDHFAWLFEKT